MPPPTPPSEPALHPQAALHLVTALVRAGFDSSDDVLRLARRFDIFGKMPQHASIDATCAEFAQNLLTDRGAISHGFFEELYQQAPSLAWARIRELTHTIAGIDLPSETPRRERPEALAEIRIELDATQLSPAEGRALLANLEGLFNAPTIRTFRFEQREDSIHALLCLPSSAARTLRRRGPRGLSRDTRRPIRRVIETSSMFILAWTMGSWWLRERGWSLVFFVTPAAVAATLLAQPAPNTLITPAIPHTEVLVARAERDLATQQYTTIVHERDTVVSDSNTLQQALDACRVGAPDPTTTTALAQCQATAVDCRLATNTLRAELAACNAKDSPPPPPDDTQLDACIAGSQTLQDNNNTLKTELDTCIAGSQTLKVNNTTLTAQVEVLTRKVNGRCPLPAGWTAITGTLGGPPSCDKSPCTAVLTSGQVLAWLPPAQRLVPKLKQGDHICAEGPMTPARKIETTLLVPNPR